MLRLSYKFRLYPNKTHLQKLESTLKLCRELYNSALLHRIQAWQKARYLVTYLEQANSLVEVKQVRAEFEEVHFLKNGNLSKSISDCSWGRFLQYIAYKAESAGKYAIGVDPRGTSQNCSNCGARVPKLLSYRVHICSKCHIVLDRDINASRNILRLGTSLLGFSPGEAPCVSWE
jgi:IS605 OrfB family transposase